MSIYWDLSITFFDIPIPGGGEGAKIIVITSPNEKKKTVFSLSRIILITKFFNCSSSHSSSSKMFKSQGIYLKSMGESMLKV